MGPRFRRLNAAVSQLLDEFSLVSFLPLDITDDESIIEVRGAGVGGGVGGMLGAWAAAKLGPAPSGLVQTEFRAGRPGPPPRPPVAAGAGAH